MSGLLDRIGHSLVGLKMPRALESLADVVRHFEQGDIGALATSARHIAATGYSSRPRPRLAANAATRSPSGRLSSTNSSRFSSGSRSTSSQQKKHTLQRRHGVSLHGAAGGCQATTNLPHGGTPSQAPDRSGPCARTAPAFAPGVEIPGNSRRETGK